MKTHLTELAELIATARWPYLCCQPDRWARFADTRYFVDHDARLPIHGSLHGLDRHCIAGHASFLANCAKTALG